MATSSPSRVRVHHVGLAACGVLLCVLGTVLVALGHGGPVLAATGLLVIAEGTALVLAATCPPTHPRTEPIVDGVRITRRAPTHVAQRAAAGWSVMAGAPGAWLVAVPWLTHATHRQLVGTLGVICGCALLATGVLPWRRDSGDGSVDLRVSGVRQSLGRRSVVVTWPVVASTPGRLPIHSEAVGLPEELLAGLMRQLAADPSTQTDLTDKLAPRRVAAVLGIESSV